MRRQPKQQRARGPGGRQGRDRADRQPRGQQRRRLAHHHPHDLHAVGAECHPDADLVPPPGHRVRDHAVQTDHRDQRGQRPEKAGQRRHEALDDHRIAQLRVHRPEIDDDRRMQLAHVRGHRRGRGAERPARAHDQPAPGDPIVLLHRHVDQRFERIAQIAVLRIARQADDFVPRLRHTRRLLDLEDPADRILAAEDDARERLRDDRDARRRRGVAVVEVPPSQQRRRHRREVAIADGVVVDVLVHRAVDDDVTVRERAADGHVADHGGVFDRRIVANAIEQTRVRRSQAIVDETGAAEVERRDHQVLPREAGVGGDQIPEAADEQQRADDQQQREGDLRDDEEPAQAEALA